MLHSKTIKSIFILSFIVAVAFPLITIYLILPSITGFLVSNTEQEAVRVAEHLALMAVSEGESLNNAALLEEVITAHKDEFNLEKVNVFLDSGEVIYSTDSSDIGTINKNSYFKQIVARGNVYSKKVEKDMMTLEDRPVTIDVVETYIPIMDGDRFLGAFEIYYDITEKNYALSRATFHSTLMLFALVVGFFISVTLILLRSDVETPSLKVMALPGIYQSPRYLHAVVLLYIFIAELLVMTMLAKLPDISVFGVAALDASLLVIFTGPPLYFFMLRPLMIHIAMQKKAEDELAQLQKKVVKPAKKPAAELTLPHKEHREENDNRGVAKH